MDGVAWHETLQKSQAENEGINGWIVMLLAFLSPFLVLLINGCIMPAIVHFLAKHLGQRYVSSMQRSTFDLLYFFTVLNVLILPALALEGLDQFLSVTHTVALNQLLGQVCSVRPHPATRCRLPALPVLRPPLSLLCVLHPSRRRLLSAVCAVSRLVSASPPHASSPRPPSTEHSSLPNTAATVPRPISTLGPLQVVIYGSSTSFFVDYIAQSALLGSAYFFVYHTTTPPSILKRKDSDGKEHAAWEFDFPSFYR